MDVGAGWKQDICHFQQDVVSMSVQYNSFLSQTKSENTPKAILARNKRVLNYILCAAPNMLHNCPYRVDKFTLSQEGDKSDLFRYLYMIH